VIVGIQTMHSVHAESSPQSLRQVYMVLSPHSLAYARVAISSLLRNSEQALDVHLITDGSADKSLLVKALLEQTPDPRHTISVTAEEELADAEASTFATFPNLRTFRRGHPCWRKITDPILLSKPNAELILLDPDLYFPNRFCFEPTPPSGLLLMWQRPNCLLPPQVVRAAMEAKIPLARHVDIGVAHWRAGVDLDWVNWLIGRLGGANLPRMMHVEAIVWAALAMRQGGGYLDHTLWVCWRRSQLKRVRRKLGVEGRSVLKSEPWAKMKCFHAGGEAKWWLPKSEVAGELQGGGPRLELARILPFVELTARQYEREQRVKGVLRGLGYYRVFGAHTG
jgi:hypothetical protein